MYRRLLARIQRQQQGNGAPQVETKRSNSLQSEETQKETSDNQHEQKEDNSESVSKCNGGDEKDSCASREKRKSLLDPPNSDDSGAKRQKLPLRIPLRPKDSFDLSLDTGLSSDLFSTKQEPAQSDKSSRHSKSGDGDHCLTLLPQQHQVAQMKSLPKALLCLSSTGRPEHKMPPSGAEILLPRPPQGSSGLSAGAPPPNSRATPPEPPTPLPKKKISGLLEMEIGVLDKVTSKGEKSSDKSKSLDNKCSETTGSRPEPRSKLSQCALQVEQLVTSLCRKPMDQQKAIKEENVLGILSTLKKQLVSTNGAAADFFTVQEEKQQYFLELDRLATVAPTEGYRTQCDFTIGLNPNSKTLAIGFLLGRNSCLVGPFSHLVHIPDTIKSVAKTFETLLISSGLPPFNPQDGTGHWMNLSVRACDNRQGALAIISFHRQSMDKCNVKNVTDRLRAFFSCDGPGANAGIASLYFNSRTQQKSGCLELLLGKDFLNVHLEGLDFRVSPRVHLALNVAAAERVLKVVSDLAQLTADCSLTDICCGAGMLGLALSSRCGQVLGLDFLEEAINDARINALNNRVTNCEFFVGSAEDFLPNLWQRVIFKEVVCLCEPPRSGLSAKAVNHLRKEARVKKIVLVLNDCQAALHSLVDLCRPSSKAYKGEPFIPVKAIPIDTFPHTKNFTLVMLFVRLPKKNTLKSWNVQPTERPHSFDHQTQRFDVPPPSTIPKEPDLTWKPVTPSKKQESEVEFKSYFNLLLENKLPSKEEKNYREALLSSQQVNWLDRMTMAYGKDFARGEWVESLIEQNRQALEAQANAAGSSRS